MCAALIVSGTPAVLPGTALAAPAAVQVTNGIQAAVHVDNPFLGTKGYVNPVWKAQAEQTPDGSKVSNNPTAVWIDTVARALGSPFNDHGLKSHLDAALEQGAGYVQVVLQNLPGKDCDQLPSNDDFQPDEVTRYQREFIDPIVAIESDPRYRSLRIINIVEPRWVQLLVLNTGSREAVTETCEAVAEAGSYVDGVRYALAKLHGAGANVYTYLDAGTYYELGWEDNFSPAVALTAETVRRTPDGFASVDGFVTNIAGYAPLTEPHFTIDTKVNGTPVRRSGWVNWNRYVDALSYAAEMRRALVAAGFSPAIGMVIDTSRNGWGGTARPAKASASQTLDTFVDDSRVDRRPYATSWCNQAGAGLGERPVAAPRTGIDAYAWVKVPGESDGATPGYVDPKKGFDRMCDPTYVVEYQSVPTGAMAGAPIRGYWHPEAFAELLANAYPPLP